MTTVLLLLGLWGCQVYIVRLLLWFTSTFVVHQRIRSFVQPVGFLYFMFLSSFTSFEPVKISTEMIPSQQGRREKTQIRRPVQFTGGDKREDGSCDRNRGFLCRNYTPKWTEFSSWLSNGFIFGAIRPLSRLCIQIGTDLKQYRYPFEVTLCALAIKISLKAPKRDISKLYH